MDSSSCYFYNLPIDLQNYIFNIIKNNSVNYIRKIYYKNKNHNEIAKNKINKLNIQIYQLVDGYYGYAYNPFSSKVIEAFTFSARILSGKKNSPWWLSRIAILKTGLDCWQNYIVSNNLYNLYKPLQHIYNIWMKLDNKLKIM